MSFKLICYAVLSLICRVRGHRMFSPTGWEIGWQSPKTGQFEHFGLPYCACCREAVVVKRSRDRYVEKCPLTDPLEQLTRHLKTVFEEKPWP